MRLELALRQWPADKLKIKPTNSLVIFWLQLPIHSIRITYQYFTTILTPQFSPHFQCRSSLSSTQKKERNSTPHQVVPPKSWAQWAHHTAHGRCRGTSFRASFTFLPRSKAFGVSGWEQTVPYLVPYHRLNHRSIRRSDDLCLLLA